jgi:hypothetical protein
VDKWLLSGREAWWLIGKETGCLSGRESWCAGLLIVYQTVVLQTRVQIQSIYLMYSIVVLPSVSLVLENIGFIYSFYVYDCNRPLATILRQRRCSLMYVY